MVMSKRSVNQLGFFVGFQGMFKHLLSKQTLVAMTLLCLYSSTLSAQEASLDMKGLVDDTHVNFKHSEVYLEGVWLFFPNQLLDPKDVASTEVTQENWINSSGAYADQLGDTSIPPISEHSWSTYRVRVLFPKHAQHLTVRLSPYLSHARVYANGQFVASVGRHPFDHRDEEIAIGGIENISGHVDMLLQISNFDAYRTPLDKLVSLGDSKVISRHVSQSKIHDTLIASSLFLIGFFHVLIFLKRKSEKEVLYFALFGILGAFYTLLSLQSIMLDLFLGLSVNDAFWLSLLVLFWCPVTLIYFFNALFKEDAWPQTQNISFMLASMFSILLFVLNQQWMVALDVSHRFVVIIPSCMYILYVIVKVVKNKRPHFKVTLIGMLLVALALIYDSLSFLGMFPAFDVAYYATLVFMLLQGVNLSLHHADAAKKLQDMQKKHENLPDDKRELGVYIMRQSIQLWEKSMGQRKTDLAEASGLWRVQLDGDTYRVRTMDRYLNLDTLPERPRWKNIIATAEYVLEQVSEASSQKEQLALAIKILNR